MAESIQTTPDIMQQFNAIRSRIDTVNQDVRPTDATTPVPPSDRIMRRDLKDADGSIALSAFSTTGEPRTKAEFNAAYASYQKVGNRVDGFTFLEPGVQEKLRSLHETVIGGPLRSASTALDSPDARINSLPTAVQGPAKALLRLPGESVKTPEAVGATLGAAAIAPAAKGLHLLKQAATVGIGAGAGSLAADVATGTNQGRSPQRISDSLMQAGIAALGQGVVGAFKMGIGQGLSQRAKEQASGDLMALLKREAAPLSNNPDGLNIYGSTRKGANDIIQVGIKALRGDIDTLSSEMVEDIAARNLRRYTRVDDYVSGLEKAKGPYDILGVRPSPKEAATYTSKVIPGKFSADQFVSDISQGAPRSLSQETATEVRKLVRQLATQGNNLLDNADNPEAFAKSQVAMRDTRQALRDAVTADFSKSSQTVKDAQLLRVNAVIEQHVQQVEKFVDFAEVLSYMKQSVGPQGFDPTMMQKLVQYKSMQNPGSVLDQSANTVFRGAKDRLAGTDEVIRKEIPLGSLLDKIPLINKIPGIGKFNLGKDIGNKYVGDVRGSYPVTEAVAAQQTTKAIRSYFEED